MTLQIEALRTFDSADFTGSYQAIGDPLVNDSVKIIIRNSANQPVYISIDGSTDHEYLSINGILVVDANSTILSFAAGTQFYIRGFEGEENEGLIFLSDYYNS